MLSLTATKLISLAGIVLISAAGIVLPSVKSFSGTSIVIGNCFSAGVLIAAVLCHFLDDSIDVVAKSIDAGSLPEFPWAQFLAGVGYLAMVSLEQSVMAWGAQLPSTKNKRTSKMRTSSHNHNHDSLAVDLICRAVENHSVTNPAMDDKAAPRTNDVTIVDTDLEMGKITVPKVPEAEVEKRSPAQRRVDFIAALGAFSALAVHSVVEGIALGAQTDRAELTTVAIAVVAHKGFAGFALGCALVKTGNTMVYAALGTVFVLVSPIGVGIGWAVADLSSSLASALLTAFCAGTLLFIATSEILAPMLSPSGVGSGTPMWARLLSVWFGFGLMAAMAIWA